MATLRSSLQSEQHNRSQTRSTPNVARVKAVRARSDFRYAQTLARRRIRIKQGSKEWLSYADQWWLDRLDNDSLRRKANSLTIESGHGTVHYKLGDTVLLGSNTYSNTRRVLDNFVPVSINDLDMQELT